MKPRANHFETVNTISKTESYCVLLGNEIVTSIQDKDTGEMIWFTRTFYSKPKTAERKLKFISDTARLSKKDRKNLAIGIAELGGFA
jgi:hypothetical protein